MEGKGRLRPDFIASNLYFFEAKFTLLVGGLLDRVLATPSREGGEKGSRVSAPPPFNLTVLTPYFWIARVAELERTWPEIGTSKFWLPTKTRCGS